MKKNNKKQDVEEQEETPDNKDKSINGEKDFSSFPIVGMGASAGGLEAFEQFFKSMPHDTGMAFVLVPHLDPTHKSMMVDLIKRVTKMEVYEVEDGMKVQPNCIYIIPPNKNMAIIHGVLQLLDLTEPRGLRLPIDFFIRSLAADQRENAICIILSGTGTSGTLSIKAIKGEVGMVMVQNPESAKYDGMPRSAIASGLVDYILPPEKMPEQLIKYVKHTYIKDVDKDDVIDETPDSLQKIFILLRNQTGHDFSLYKPNTINRRIERRMVLHQIEALPDYVDYLQENMHEVEMLFKELLIGVTSFFRDPEAFELIKTKVLPHLFENKPLERPLRIWIAGCSTGEEAYSIAMLLREYMDKKRQEHRIQIFATDIDGGAIETARLGVYPESIAADVSGERLKRFFIKEGSVYQIKKEVRDMIVFAVQNIINDPPFSKLDLISCRNLLIYLSSVLQKKLLPLFHYILQQNGILFLGSSETIGEFVNLFSIFNGKWKFFSRNELPPSAQVMIDFPTSSLINALDTHVTAEKREVSFSKHVEKMLVVDAPHGKPSGFLIRRSEPVQTQS